jgi:hypothetical protein
MLNRIGTEVDCRWGIYHLVYLHIYIYIYLFIYIEHQ